MTITTQREDHGNNYRHAQEERQEEEEQDDDWHPKLSVCQQAVLLLRGVPDWDARSGEHQQLRQLPGELPAHLQDQEVQVRTDAEDSQQVINDWAVFLRRQLTLDLRNNMDQSGDESDAEQYSTLGRNNKTRPRSRHSTSTYRSASPSWWFDELLLFTCCEIAWLETWIIL